LDRANKVPHFRWAPSVAAPLQTPPLPRAITGHSSNNYYTTKLSSLQHRNELRSSSTHIHYCYLKITHSWTKLRHNCNAQQNNTEQ